MKGNGHFQPMKQCLLFKALFAFFKSLKGKETKLKLRTAHLEFNQILSPLWNFNPVLGERLAGGGSQAQ